MQLSFINLNTYCCARLYSSVPMVITHNGMNLVKIIVVRSDDGCVAETSNRNVKQSCYRPEQAQRVDRGIALPFRDLGARRGVWSTTRPGQFTSGKDPVPIVQEAGWASGPIWTYAKHLAPTGIRSPDRPARSQSLC
jgi:hypothetical protein